MHRHSHSEQRARDKGQGQGRTSTGSVTLMVMGPEGTCSGLGLGPESRSCSSSALTCEGARDAFLLARFCAFFVWNSADVHARVSEILVGV